MSTGERLRVLAAEWRAQAVRLRQHQHPSNRDAVWCRVTADTLDGCADDLEGVLAVSTVTCRKRNMED